MLRSEESLVNLRKTFNYLRLKRNLKICHRRCQYFIIFIVFFDPKQYEPRRLSRLFID